MIESRPPQKKGRSHDIVAFLVPLLLSLALLAYVSPQVSFEGRGLNTALPSYALAVGILAALRPQCLLRAVRRFWLSILLGILFVALACWRFLFVAGLESLIHRYVVGAGAVILFLVAFAANAELGEKAVRRLRVVVVTCLSLSLIAGIPALLSTPGGGRMIMDTTLRAEMRTGLMSRGIGEYSIYSSVAVALVPMMFMGRGLNWSVSVLFVLLGVGVYASVLLSTFTMAVVIATIGVVAAIAIWTVEHRRGGMALRAILSSLFVVLVLGLVLQMADLPQMEYVVTKASRLYTGIFGSGLAQGDETGRGEMFMEDINGFVRSPIVGYLPGVLGQIDGGHSSFTNSLVLFGVIQGPMWFLILLLVGHDAWKNASAGVPRSVVLAGWIALFAGGILNPMWHSPIIMGLLICLTLPPRRRSHQLGQSRMRNHHNLENRRSAPWPSPMRQGKGGFNAS